MSNAQTILLNGRRYDALTGKLLKEKEDNSIAGLHPNPKHSSVKQSVHHRKIDGIFNSASGARTFADNKRHQLSSSSHKNHSIAPHISRATEHSRTLMREGVKKPVEDKLRHHQKTAIHHVNNAISRGMAASAPAREAVVNQARSIQRSDFVARVNAVASAPAPNFVKPDPNVIQTTANSEVHLTNLNRLAQLETSPKLDDIFSEAALKLDDSHQPVKSQELRFYDKLADKLRISVKMLFVISITLFVIIFGLITSIVFSNNISIYIADSRTNIHGILPTYTPTGFGVSSIKYAVGNPTGTITIDYSSNNGSSYKIQEEETTWDSQSLINSVITPDVGTNYKSYQVGGRSVFMYNHTAVWVDSGVYYILTNQAQLSPNQINRIVNTT